MVILVCLLFGISALIPFAHASTYVGFTATQASAATCSGTLCAPSVGDAATGNGFGEIVQAPFTGSLVAAGVFTGTGTPNQIVILSFPAGTTPSTTAYPNGFCNGSCYTTNTGQTFTVVDVESVSGMSPDAFNTVSLAAPPSVTNGQWFAIVWMQTSGSSQYTMTACGGVSATCSSFGNTVAAIGFTFGTTNPSGTFSSQCLPNSCGGPFVEGPITTGASFNPAGTAGPTVTVTQCYGNCGTPPITLAKTNSTHTFNFNASIFLMYQFQSNVNGFILNVTTNVAKSYSNGMQVLLGIYTISSCPIGQLPFTNACPGTLAAASGNFINPAKGQISAGPFQIPVSNGQWVGIAVGAIGSGLDLNDTNAQVPLYQASGNPPPPTLSANALLNQNSLMGLWAWIRGNVVSGNGPTTPPSGVCTNNFAQIDCLLPALTNTFCTTVSTACQTESALIWIPILALLFVAVVFGAMHSMFPSLQISFGSLGEIFVVMIVVFTLVFSAASLLPPYVPLFMFFIAAIMLGKKLDGYF